MVSQGLRRRLEFEPVREPGVKERVAALFHDEEIGGAASPGRVSQNAPRDPDGAVGVRPVKLQQVVYRPVHESLERCAVHHFVGAYLRVAGVDGIRREVLLPEGPGLRAGCRGMVVPYPTA